MTLENETRAIYCQADNCAWVGYADELVCTNDDPDNFTHCPWCDGEKMDIV